MPILYFSHFLQPCQNVEMTTCRTVTKSSELNCQLVQSKKENVMAPGLPSKPTPPAHMTSTTSPTSRREPLYQCVLLTRITTKWISTKF